MDLGVDPPGVKTISVGLGQDNGRGHLVEHLANLCTHGPALNLGSSRSHDCISLHSAVAVAAAAVAVAAFAVAVAAFAVVAVAVAVADA